MSYRNSEDWVHVDHYNDEVSRLEKKVKELEEVIFEQDEEKVRLLAELIMIRDYLDVSPALASRELLKIINTHDKADIKKAENLIMEVEQ
jgi:hypothetical protein